MLLAKENSGCPFDSRHALLLERPFLLGHMESIGVKILDLGTNVGFGLERTRSKALLFDQDYLLSMDTFY